MGKAYGVKLSWVLVAVMIVPGAMIMAEDPPSTRDQPIREAEPAAAAPAPPAAGAMAVPTPPAGSWGIVSEGDGGGGIFRDTDSEAEAWLGSEGTGVHGFGIQAGGFFQDTDNTGYAYVGYLGWGIGGYGISAGGYFEDIDGSGLAWVGKNNLGIEAHGNTAGGYFVNTGGTGLAWVGGNYWGIEAHGNGGGYFVDSDGPAFAAVGHDDFGIEGFGPVAGGHFADSTGSGQAWVGHEDFGIESHGSVVGGFFKDSDGSGQAYVGYGDVGIDASGSGAGGIFQNTLSDEAAWLATGGGYGVHGFGLEAGGRFENTHGTGWANVAGDVWGIEARGETAGGYFRDLTGTGVAYVGHADYGIEAHGTAVGGYFDDIDGTGRAWVGYGDYGIEGMGDEAGGYFWDSDGTGVAYVGHADYGIEASGGLAGGLFKDSNDSGWAWVGFQGYGIRAVGDESGGVFEAGDGTGFALVARGDSGIRAFGALAGGYFKDSDGSGYANVGYGDRGIEAFGDGAGGHFEDLDEGTYSNVAISTYSIHGNGTKAFVQNHPYDRDSVIVYAAPEGDEVATYTRGTARIVDGEATVPLGETFKWVTNPDIGLTVHLTPVGDPCVLYVIDQATDEITVRSDGGNDCTFHYLVYGLRIGFEEVSIVQEKEREAYIPSMAGHRQLYQRRPDLLSYNSLERFKVMRRAAGLEDELDLSRTQALRNAVVEFDPAVHEMSRPPEFEKMPGEDATGGSESHEGRAQGRQRDTAARVDRAGQQAVVHSGLGATIPVDDEGNVYANSFRPASQDFASLLEVSETVEPGDVLVIDRNNQGMMRRAFEGSDTGVIGVVAAKPGVVLGTNPPSSGISGTHDSVIVDPVPGETETAVSESLRAAVALAGVVSCKVDADYGAVWPGDLLVTSPTPGHAMRTDAPLPGTMLGKALEPLVEGTGAIRVLVMLR